MGLCGTETWSGDYPLLTKAGPTPQPYINGKLYLAANIRRALLEMALLQVVMFFHVSHNYAYFTTIMPIT